MTTDTSRNIPSECSSESKSGIDVLILMPTAYQIGRTHLRPRQQCVATALQRDPSVDHDVTAVSKFQGMEGVLLNQKDRELLLRVECPDRIEDLACDQWREAERGFVE